MKADLKTKLIIQVATTAASVHDSQVFEELLDGGKTKPCWPTAPITAPSMKSASSKLNAQEFLMRKATRFPSPERSGAADQPHHQPDECEGGIHLCADGADGG